jgi:LmbE family N-acetylglucosaminyl deacetylase
VRAGDYLKLVREFDVVPFTDLTGKNPFLILSPHPDDETLGAGGLIAAARQQSQDVHVVVLTDGSQSHPNSRLYPRRRLINLRKTELERAGLLLGLSSKCVHELNLPDTALPSSGATFDVSVRQIAGIIEAFGVKSLFVTWECDPHCDHQSAAVLAKAVRSQIDDIKLWAFPIWGWHLDAEIEVDQPPPRGRRIDIVNEQAIKRSAIACHTSQMTDLVSDDPAGFRFTNATLAPFLGPFEYFIEVPE